MESKNIKILLGIVIIIIIIIICLILISSFFGGCGNLNKDCCEENKCNSDNLICLNGQCVNGQIQQCGTTDVGACQYGTQICLNGQCDSCEGVIEPTTEICNNIDDDCDGTVDEELTQPTACGVGACSGNTGFETCTAGAWSGDTCNPLAGAATEICNDSKDNDCDSDTDMNDSDCLPLYGDCKAVVYNGNISDKIDVVFVGSGFLNLTIFQQTVNEMIDYDSTEYGLMSVEPFKTNKTKFNFWLLNNLQTFTDGSPDYDSQASALVQEKCFFADEMIDLSVTPRFVSHAYVFVNTDRGAHRSYVTIGCEYLGTCSWPLDIDGGNYGSNKNAVIRTTVHEVGHGFGGLRDEYSFSNTGSTCPPIIPNCDNSSCDKWSNITSDCISTCGYTNWYRAYSNTIMKSQYMLSDDFNTVNEKELRKDINDYNTSIGNLSEAYSLLLTFENGIISYKNLTFVDKPTPNIIPQTSGDYLIKVVADDGTTIYQSWVSFSVMSSYAPPMDWFDKKGVQIYIPDESEVIKYENLTEIKLFIPYSKDVKINKINIYDSDNNPVISVCKTDRDRYVICEVEYLKQDGETCKQDSECQGNYCVHNTCRSTPTYCGDKYCDKGEDYRNCDDDCPSQ